MDIPYWLDELFLTLILQEGKSNVKIKIVKYAVKPIDATYFTSDVRQVSVVYRIEGSAEERSVSLIIKQPISTGMFGELSKKTNFYEIEPLVYNKLLPKMQAKLKMKIAPKSYKCPIKSVLVLQDIRPLGYSVTKRYKQYDFAHSKAIIKIMAKFHAGSVACHSEDPELVESVGKERFYIMGGPHKARFEHWIKEDFKQCAKTMMELGVDKSITDFIYSRADDKLWERISKLNMANPNTLNVLNHGDIWTNNVLFKYRTDGKISDLKLIDFQLGKYGSPVLDLIYFIWSQVCEEVRETKLPELYRIYLKTLNKTLKKLECSKTMTYQQLERDLKDYIDWTLLVICFVFTFLMCEPEDFIDEGLLTFDQLRNIEKDPRFQKYFTNKNVRPLLPGIARQLRPFIAP